MASSRVIPAALWSLPAAGAAVLLLWSGVDALEVPSPNIRTLLVSVLALAAVSLSLGFMIPAGFLRRAGLLLALAAYFASRTVYLGIDVLAALVYLSLTILVIQVRVLADLAGPMYRQDLSPEMRVRMRNALARAGLRLFVAGALAVVVPLLAADLALAGTVPSTTIPTAVVLAGGLVAVVFVLALLPTLQRRSA